MQAKPMLLLSSGLVSWRSLHSLYMCQGQLPHVPRPSPPSQGRQGMTLPSIRVPCLPPLFSLLTVGYRALMSASVNLSVCCSAEFQRSQPKRPQLRFQSGRTSDCTPLRIDSHPRRSTLDGLLKFERLAVRTS